MIERCVFTFKWIILTNSIQLIHPYYQFWKYNIVSYTFFERLVRQLQGQTRNRFIKISCIEHKTFHLLFLLLLPWLCYTFCLREIVNCFRRYSLKLVVHIILHRRTQKILSGRLDTMIWVSLTQWSFYIEMNMQTWENAFSILLRDFVFLLEHSMAKYHFAINYIFNVKCPSNEWSMFEIVLFFQLSSYYT